MKIYLHHTVREISVLLVYFLRRKGEVKIDHGAGQKIELVASPTSSLLENPHVDICTTIVRTNSRMNGCC